MTLDAPIVAPAAATISADQLGDYLSGFLRLTQACGAQQSELIRSALVALRDGRHIDTLVALAEVAHEHGEDRARKALQAVAPPPARLDAQAKAPAYTPAEIELLRTWRGGKKERLPRLIEDEVKRMLRAGKSHADCCRRFSLSASPVRRLSEEVAAEDLLNKAAPRRVDADVPLGGAMPDWAIDPA